MKHTSDGSAETDSDRSQSLNNEPLRSLELYPYVASSKSINYNMTCESISMYKSERRHKKNNLRIIDTEVCKFDFHLLQCSNDM